MEREWQWLMAEQAREGHLVCLRVACRSGLGRSPAVEISGHHEAGTLGGAAAYVPVYGHAEDSRYYTDSRKMTIRYLAFSTWCQRFRVGLNGCSKDCTISMTRGRDVERLTGVHLEAEHTRRSNSLTFSD